MKVSDRAKLTGFYTLLIEKLRSPPPVKLLVNPFLMVIVEVFPEHTPEAHWQVNPEPNPAKFVQEASDVVALRILA